MKRNIILIVDDDPGVRKISELWIKTYFPDNEVLLASGVDEAIEILQNQPIHVVISDWAMPEPDDGFVLAGKLEEYGFDMDQFLLTSGELSAGELPEGIDIQFVPKGDLDGLKAWCGDHIEPYQHVRHKNNEMRTLLVIDDDELVRETFLTWVSHTFPTLEVETAETLEQITESIGKVPSPYAVITDYDLGDFDANSVWKLLKESWGESKANEDIVVVSGLEREDIGSMSFIGKGNLQAISSWIEEKFY
ncbi:MAG: hypothetical protein CL438_05735 [Acidimicrobiaceae bacterium]|nr:hypothetical protein [Acidimicrobiaceae bacterium]|tara:strand:- start:229 stop:975 length:747 start_codon:yes stop_codon:yes gene_type:complete